MNQADVAAYLWAAAGSLSMLALWETARVGLRRLRIRRNTRHVVRDAAALAALVRESQAARQRTVDHCAGMLVRRKSRRGNDDR